MLESFYDVLLVHQDATLDEIKLAFKRRALQVHPDKGGSKETFHLVYQALETLADPAARKRYDSSLALNLRGGQQRQCEPGRKKKAARKFRTSTNTGHEKAQPAAWRNREAEAKSNQPRQTQLLLKLRDLLKKLPRDLRNDVIVKEFSQRQRLILEKWMVDTSKAPLQAAPQKVHPKRPLKPPALYDFAHPRDGCAFPSASSKKTSPETKKGCKSTRKEPKPHGRSKLSTSGSVYKINGDTHYYRACIRFDGLDIHTGQYDLQTALEYLVILTAVKQKMRESTSEQLFNERLAAALVASAAEQGRDFADLDLRFAIHQPAGFLVARGFQVRSPSVRNLEDLGKLRNGIRPFRKYACKTGRGSIFWRHSPVELQQAWECFKKAIADAWEIAGSDSTKYLGNIRFLREANACVRDRHLRTWECRHMAMQDKNKFRPKRLRTPLPFRSQTWERRQMGREDRAIHQPGGWKTRSPEDILAANLFALKKLLGKWGRLLKSEDQVANRERRKLLQQQKKHREEQRKMEVLKRKRLREQERFRREHLRKRMKSDTMGLDLAWMNV